MLVVIGVSVIVQTVYSYRFQPTILLLFGDQSLIDLSIQLYTLITVFILVVQVSSISTIYKAINHNVDNEISNSTFDEDEKLKSSIYRHLYRLQVYLLEPFFSGYLLSLILSSNKLKDSGVETSTFYRIGLIVTTIVAVLQSVLYSCFIDTPLPS